MTTDRIAQIADQMRAASVRNPGTSGVPASVAIGVIREAMARDLTDADLRSEVVAVIEALDSVTASAVDELAATVAQIEAERGQW